MKILEGKCFLISSSEEFLMVIILIFGLISVSQVSAESQDATPAPPNAKYSSKDGKGVERWAPQLPSPSFQGNPSFNPSFNRPSFQGNPSFNPSFNRPSFQGNPSINRPPQEFVDAHNSITSQQKQIEKEAENTKAGIESFWVVIIVLLVIGVIAGCVVLCICCNRKNRPNQPGMVYGAPPQGGIAGAPPGYQYGQGQKPMASSPQNGMPYGQGQMPMTSSPQYGMPYGQGQMPMASSPQNGMPYGQVEKAPA